MYDLLVFLVAVVVFFALVLDTMSSNSVASIVVDDAKDESQCDKLSKHNKDSQFNSIVKQLVVVEILPSSIKLRRCAFLYNIIF